jgi:hypothetical protein
VTPGGLSSPNYTITFVPGALTISKDGTTVTLASSKSPSQFGQKVTFTATVTAQSPGSGTPSGTVTFYDGKYAVAVGTLSGGQATLTTGALPGGTSSLTAVYSGDGNFTGATSAAITQTVTFTSTISGTNSAPVTVKSGQSLLITGTVSGSLTVSAGGAVELQGGKVVGPVNATGTTALEFCDGTFGGPVTVSDSSGFVLIGGAVDDPLFGCAADSISGPLALSGNTGSAAVEGTTIGGSLSLTGTTGIEPIAADQAVSVEANTISGGLSCSTNNPAPINGGHTNKVGGNKSGQCAKL